MVVLDHSAPETTSDEQGCLITLLCNRNAVAKDASDATDATNVTDAKDTVLFYLHNPIIRTDPIRL